MHDDSVHYLKQSREPAVLMHVLVKTATTVTIYFFKLYVNRYILNHVRQKNKKRRYSRMGKDR